MIAAIYARKSTEQTGVVEEQKSVARQIEHAKDFARRKCWRVAAEHIYSDDGISGAEFSKRPGLVRLLAALKPKPAFQVLIVSEESRLGRESIETAYILKQLICAGVRVFFHLEDRERTLDSTTEKIMLQLTNFADEMERERARVRTYDAMVPKAKAGHVTGGKVFGYDNVDVVGTTLDAQGQAKRSHVELRINEAEAEIVRTIFRLYVDGHGFTTIAKKVNADGAPCPRPHPAVGKPSGWVSSSVRAIVLRRLYRGEQVWGRTKKQDKWGQKKPHRRPEQDWVIVPVPHLQIVPDALWMEAQARLAKQPAVLSARHEWRAAWPPRQRQGIPIPLHGLHGLSALRWEPLRAESSLRRPSHVSLRLHDALPARPGEVSRADADADGRAGSRHPRADRARRPAPGDHHESHREGDARTACDCRPTGCPARAAPERSSAHRN
jgi:DNA invertase Pin-like site-specific DNA recombinase